MGAGVAVPRLRQRRQAGPALRQLLPLARPRRPASRPPTLALYRNKGDGTFEDVTERGRPGRHAVRHGRRPSATTTTTAGPTCSSPASAATACSATSRRQGAFARRDRDGRRRRAGRLAGRRPRRLPRAAKQPIPFGHVGDVPRLRRRRPARPVRLQLRHLVAGDRPDASSFTLAGGGRAYGPPTRVRGGAVRPVPQPRRRHVRGRVRDGRRPGRRARGHRPRRRSGRSASRWAWSSATSTATAGRTSSSPTTRCATSSSTTSPGPTARGVSRRSA